ncbi:MAG: hypothetical protein EOP46_04530 [Sphingobacteriaceae bacterium]|nr:MAG: hypothetical protein EOP46_04530 [Sphingobacteriaceae bacterium]
MEPNKFSDSGWYTSQFREKVFRIGINDFVSFTDVSKNTTSHQWMINDGSFFLKGDITSQDSVFDKFISGTALKSEDKTVHVLFRKGGLQQVRLYNTFSQNVANSQKVGNMYVVDTTFTVDVYDTIVAKIQIRQKGVEVPLNKDTIYVEAGQSLEFIDLTTIGRPDTRRWSVAGETSADSAATITLKKMGVFSGSFQSSRTGQHIPGDWDDIRIPNPIKVIPSKSPFIIAGDITELANETIEIPFNSEFAAFNNQQQFFSVAVSGPNVNGKAFTVRSVSVKPGDATKLHLQLSDKIYGSDVITVSYSGGSLSSTDSRSLAAFVNQSVKMHSTNLLSAAEFGFENGGISWDKVEGDGTVSFTTEKASSGRYSMKVVKTAANNGVHAESVGAKFDLKAGKTYTFKYNIWVDPSTTGNGLNFWLISNWRQFFLWIPDIAKGQWVTKSFEYTPGADEDDRVLRIQAYEDGIFYFDDFYVGEKDERP